MAEAQFAITGYNIAGLDPIEVAHSSTGATVDLSADTTAYGKMHIMSGTANYSCILPPAAGHEGETIGFRGSNLLTGNVTLDGSGTEPIDGNATVRMTKNEVRVMRATSAQWVTHGGRLLPSGRGAFSAYQVSNQSVSSEVLTLLNIQTIDFDPEGWYNISTATFSPTLSGYYLFILGIATGGSSATNQFVQAHLYRNGTPYRVGPIIFTPQLGPSLNCSLNVIAYATTSHSFQPYVLSRVPMVAAGAANTFFQAIYLGGE